MGVSLNQWFIADPTTADYDDLTDQERIGTSSGHVPHGMHKMYEAGDAEVRREGTLWCAQGCASRLWKADGQRREPLRNLK